MVLRLATDLAQPCPGRDLNLSNSGRTRKGRGLGLSQKPRYRSATILRSAAIVRCIVPKWHQQLICSGCGVRQVGCCAYR